MMEQQNGWMRFANRILTITLRSPLYPLAGKTLIITVIGRKSGKAYTLPVNYARAGDVVTIISRRWRTWWRNLRGGAAVTLHLQGREAKGWGTVIEDEPDVAAALREYVQQLPRVPRRYRDLGQATQTRVVVRVKLQSQERGRS